ncbi:MAG: chitobiase/beta-hexosaminidase C-terminal domain-containing protein [Caldilineaceae bacterium]
MTSCATTRPRPARHNDAAGTPVTLAAVAFSHARGLYDVPFALTLRTDDHTAAIRYTHAGRQRTHTGTHGTLYAEPISIDGTTLVRAVAVAPAAAPGPVATQTFIFPAAVIRVNRLRRRARLHHVGHADRLRRLPCRRRSRPTTPWTRIADDPIYGPQLRDSFAALPILSLSGGDGIWQLYADPPGAAAPVEQPCRGGVLRSPGPRAGLCRGARGLASRAAGRWSSCPSTRSASSFAATTARPNCASPFFPDSPAQEYNALVLRADADQLCRPSIRETVRTIARISML